MLNLHGQKLGALFSLLATGVEVGVTLRRAVGAFFNNN
jgi:hypothetical protein